MINLEKCVLGDSQGQYLGHLINEQGTRPLPDRVEAVHSFTKPVTISDLRRFLGIINFYRKSLKNAAEVQAPLHVYLVGAKKKDKRLIECTAR